MQCICFVCDEIYPTTPGGAGYVIYSLAQDLLSQGHKVIFLLNLPKVLFDRFNATGRKNLKNSENCRTYHVDTLCAQIPYRAEDFLSRFLWDSFRYDFACRQIYVLEKPDLIEFVDFRGPAYFALSAKACGLCYQDARIIVRLHGSIEGIDHNAINRAIDFDRFTIYLLEEMSLKLADAVFSPTPSYLAEYPYLSDMPLFGTPYYSKPEVSQPPKRSHQEPDANIVLFFGRLHIVKGVNLFVDAAVRFIEENPQSVLVFYLAGYDSNEPPDPSSGSYQEFLLQKIPKEHYHRFKFMGFLDRDTLEGLLPDVKFAVFPSYFESYCLAAHELHLAGVPLILSTIPAFEDFFEPETDAIFFDGTMSSLVQQIKRLDSDNILRESLGRPALQPAGDWLKTYTTPLSPSWMDQTPPEKLPSLLVIIVDRGEGQNEIEKTLNSLRSSSFQPEKILLLRRSGKKDHSGSKAWIFGDLYACYDLSGQAISSQNITTEESLLVLCAGDLISSNYIPLSLDILARLPQISFVTCFKRLRDGKREWVQTHSLATMLAIAPFELLSRFSRCVMRTPANQMLIDLFDPRAEELAEIKYLWSLDNSQTCGALIPESCVSEKVEITRGHGKRSLSFLVMNDRSRMRQAQFARYLVMLANSYPSPTLPVQSSITKKSRLSRLFTPYRKMNVVLQPRYQYRLVQRLNRGSTFSQHILTVLRLFWKKTRAFRK